MQPEPPAPHLTLSLSPLQLLEHPPCLPGPALAGVQSQVLQAPSWVLLLTPTHQPPWHPGNCLCVRHLALGPADYTSSPDARDTTTCPTSSRGLCTSAAQTGNPGALPPSLSLVLVSDPSGDFSSEHVRVPLLPSSPTVTALTHAVGSSASTLLPHVCFLWPCDKPPHTWWLDISRGP